jgi:hypothetical protein
MSINSNIDTLTEFGFNFAIFSLGPGILLATNRTMPGDHSFQHNRHVVSTTTHHFPC